MMQKKEAESRSKSKARVSGGHPEGVRSNSGADTSVPITGQPTPAIKNLMAQVLSRRNMLMAYQRVVSNKGAAGVDGMQVEDLKPYLETNWNSIKERLEQGSYYPQAVRKVEIPKPGGAGMRMLGIPTAVDRLINQAIQQVLSPIWERTFSESSYGFRPGRSAADAVRKAQSYQEEGLKVVVDIDLSKFFDEVNHQRLMSRIMERTPGEWQLHRLIDRYLKAGIMEGGMTEAREKGTPQGSPLALRTHPQTLSLPGDWKSGEEDFNFGYFIKSSIFMTNEKITAFGAGKAHQSGTNLIGTTKTAFGYRSATNRDVWCITDTSLPVYPTSQIKRGSGCHSRKHSGLYRKTVTQSDCSGKGVCYFTKNLDQQSSQGGIGRVFSQKSPWSKRRDKLTCPIATTACGSKNSHRFTSSSSPRGRAPLPRQISNNQS
jgi:hypothetical protein